METRLNILETRLMAHTSQECEKVETKLLSEFFKWGPHIAICARRQALDNTLSRSTTEDQGDSEDRVTSLNAAAA